MKKTIELFILSFSVVFLLLAKCYCQNSYDSIMDIDGNTYRTIEIGSQVWMIENLKTTRFNDSSNIILITDTLSWSELYEPSYCWYNNDTSNKYIYGALYNWEAINTKKLCPFGWQVPSRSDWSILIESLGGYEIAGKNMKINDSLINSKSIENITNIIGFAALFGGYRSFDGSFNDIGLKGSWWCSDTEYANEAWSWGVYSDLNRMSRNFGSKICGQSVRCIKE